jgi:hypothetical protein
MKKGLIVILTIVLGCKTSSQSNLEYDDLYYTSKDRLEAARQKAPEATIVNGSQSSDSAVKSDTYIQGGEKKQTPASTGQSDTYIYNFDSRTFEKVVPKKDTAGTNNNSNQNIPSGSGVKPDSTR